MERGGRNFVAKERAHAISHLAGSGHGIGEGEDFLRLRVSLLNQTGNAMDENRRFAGAGACYNQHRSVNVVDRFALPIVGKEWMRF
jgi:hypothetical protein